MKLKLGDFDKVIKNKSKEESLIDTNYTLSVCFDENESGSRPCGNGGGLQIGPTTVCEIDADIISKFFTFFYFNWY